MLEAALRALHERGDFRVGHFSVQGNHIHLLVEATNCRSLAGGMKAMAIRLARGLNSMMGSKGAVFDDRYHSHPLRTPTEVRRALVYVLGNYRSHAERRGERLHPDFIDRFASSYPQNRELVVEPRTWLLKTGWSRGLT